MYLFSHFLIMNIVNDKIIDFESKDKYEKLKILMNDRGLISKFGGFIRDCYMIRSNFLYAAKR